MFVKIQDFNPLNFFSFTHKVTDLPWAVTMTSPLDQHCSAAAAPGQTEEVTGQAKSGNASTGLNKQEAPSHLGNRGSPSSAYQPHIFLKEISKFLAELLKPIEANVF